MDKPVIILGGKIWGSLLAWRLKEALPHVKFRLYEESSSLGGQVAYSFRESDCHQSLKWLRPLISHSWNQHHVKFHTFDKKISSSYHLIQTEHLHNCVSAKLGSDLRLNNTLTPEFALKEGSFVIDTRNSCFYKRTGFKKHLSLHIELPESHNLLAPVILDGGVDQKDRFRSLSYFPLNQNSLIVRDTWYSESQKIDLDEMRRSLCESIYAKGWRINRILREESSFTEIPLSSPVLREESRVISLAGIFHDTTGCPISYATELIDKMVSTSFRYGELLEVVKAFRKNIENDREYFRYLNKQLLDGNQSRLLEAIYSQSYPVLERFSKGRITFLDRSRINLGKSQKRLSGLLSMVLPYSLYPNVQYARNFASKN